jgi:hypothetical protein
MSQKNITKNEPWILLSISLTEHFLSSVVQDLTFVPSFWTDSGAA